MTVVLALVATGGAACSANLVRLSAEDIGETRRWVRETRPASALVEGRVEYANSEGAFYDAAVIFTTADGRSIRTSVRQTANGDLVKDPKVGKNVPIRYDPAVPEDARLAGSVELWFRPIAVGLFMTVMFVLCLATLGHIALYFPEYVGGKLWH